MSVDGFVPNSVECGEYGVVSVLLVGITFRIELDFGIVHQLCVIRQ